jgi:nucleotide-binding universal stress UspA family protein
MKTWEIRSILLPFDFSEPSLAALAAAKDLGRQWDAQIELLHVRTLPTVYIGNALGSQYPVPTEESRRSLESRLREKTGNFRRLRVHVLEGDPEDLARRLGEDAAADILVMGTHGYTGVNRMLMSSVVEAVVRNSRVPVLSVHAGLTAFRPRRILAPLNFSEHSEATYESAVSLAREFDADLHLIHVLEPWLHPTVEGEVATRRLEAAADAVAGLRVTTQLASGSPVHEILQAARYEKSDLIVASSHPRHIGRELLIGTTAERLLRHSAVPVIAIPSEAYALIDNPEEAAIRGTVPG